MKQGNPFRSAKVNQIKNQNSEILNALEALTKKKKIQKKKTYQRC